MPACPLTLGGGQVGSPAWMTAPVGRLSRQTSPGPGGRRLYQITGPHAAAGHAGVAFIAEADVRPSLMSEPPLNSTATRIAAAAETAAKRSPSTSAMAQPSRRAASPGGWA